MNLHDRIIELISIKCGGNVSAFCRSTGLATGFINNIKNSAQPKTIDKILKAYPDINKIWLLTGEGEMLNSNSTFSIPPPDVNIKSDPTKIFAHLESRIAELKDENKWLKKQIELKDEQIKHYMKRGESCQPGPEDTTRNSQEESL